MQLRLILTSAATAALLANASLAQTATDPVTGAELPADPAIAAVEPRFTSKEGMLVGDVLGMITYDPEDDRIGEIDYVLMQADTLSAVIGIGGFLGLGEYTVALPFDEFELRPDGLGFTLNTDKETLKQVPEFDESGAESLPVETPVVTLMGQTEPSTGSTGATTETEGAGAAADTADEPAAAGTEATGSEATGTEATESEATETESSGSEATEDECRDAEGNVMAECPTPDASDMSEPSTTETPSN